MMQLKLRIHSNEILHLIDTILEKGGDFMCETDFSLRLAQLRTKKGVSARDMSLSLGQNAGYINNIESGKALPSMGTFFYICEYLNITPRDFFDTGTANPEKLDHLVKKLKMLNDAQFDSISTLIDGIVSRK